MPNVAGKKYPHTPAGIKAAKKAKPGRNGGQTLLEILKK